MELEADLDRLDEALRQLFQAMKRPGAWSSMTANAGIQIDRPAATILHILMAHESEAMPCRLNDVAEHLGVEAPSVTRKTQELEQAGLIKRQRDSEDKRAVDLIVTPKGHEIGKRLWQARRDNIAQVFKNWPTADRQQFISYLERYSRDLADSYQETNKAPKAH